MVYRPSVNSARSGKNSGDSGNELSRLKVAVRLNNRMPSGWDKNGTFLGDSSWSNAQGMDGFRGNGKSVGSMSEP